jgi:predicted acyltransferase
VLITVGLAMLALAACYWLVDVKQLRGLWTSFAVVFGTNCIFAYALSEFAATAAWVFKVHLDGKLISIKDAYAQLTFDNIPYPHWSSLGFSLSYVAICWFFTWLLYRRKIFLKV